MKYEAKARGLRLDLPMWEAGALLALAQRGLAGAADISATTRGEGERLLAELAAARDAQERRDRDARGRAADRRAARTPRENDRERHSTVDGHGVWATRDDYVDVSTSPDWQGWQSLPYLEALNRAPAQADIRRDVWLVRVSNLNRGPDDRTFIGSDVTATADPREIEPLARRILETNPRKES